jgi:hypothetical protein
MMRQRHLAILVSAAAVMLAAVVAHAWLGTNKPAAAIEYSAGTFSAAASGGVLHDITGPSKWFNSGVSSFATITGYAHSGETGLTQAQANARVTAIQIWGWLDTDGDGTADLNDARTGSRTTQWTKLSELTPSNASSSLSVSGQETAPYGFAFKTDGTKFYLVGHAGDAIDEYALSPAWDITSATLNDTTSIPDGINPSAVAFKSDGTVIYILEEGSDVVYQYSLSVAWDASTIGASTASLNVAGDTASAVSMFFRDDGSDVFVVDAATGDKIIKYDLSTPWDLSTAGSASSVVTGLATPVAAFVGNSGNTLYIATLDVADTISVYSLSTPWDLTTLGTADLTFDATVDVGSTSLRGICVGNDGSDLYYGDFSSADIYQRTITAWSLPAPGNVVGWEVSTGAPDTTSAWDDVIQTSNGGTAVTVAPGESWLFLIRVVNTYGDTNLMDTVSGTEQWDNGDTSDGIGSDVVGEQFIDANGNTPGTSDGRVDDADIVWTYINESG